MQFLHKSVFQSHGNLTSANCHVDSRWMLKIGGIGLHAFHQEDEVNQVLWRVTIIANERVSSSHELSLSHDDNAHFQRLKSGYDKEAQCSVLTDSLIEHLNI